MSSYFYNGINRIRAVGSYMYNGSWALAAKIRSSAQSLVYAPPFHKHDYVDHIYSYDMALPAHNYLLTVLPGEQIPHAELEEKTLVLLISKDNLILDLAFYNY